MVLLGCAPVISNRGYVQDPNTEASINVGKDNRASIETKFGDPTVRATFDNDSWYYVSSLEKQVAFFTPTIQNRAILAIYFDKDGTVAGIKRYGLADGNVVVFETRQTPSRGRELTFLQQLFNATPGMPGGGMGQQEQNPGGGGGGPGR